MAKLVIAQCVQIFEFSISWFLGRCFLRSNGASCIYGFITHMPPFVSGVVKYTSAAREYVMFLPMVGGNHIHRGELQETILRYCVFRMVKRKLRYEACLADFHYSYAMCTQNSSIAQRSMA